VRKRAADHPGDLLQREPEHAVFLAVVHVAQTRDPRASSRPGAAAQVFVAGP
jgi:hypothetical protein